MFNKFLTFLIALIFVAVVAGTAIAIFRLHARPGEGLEKIHETVPDASLGKFGRGVQYNLIGKMWIPLKSGKDEPKATLIVSPYLEYAEDRTFYEEMDRKYSEIKGIISDFFSSMTLYELQSKDEEILKTELTARINGILILGKIDRILFNDYQFLVE